MCVGVLEVLLISLKTLKRLIHVSFIVASLNMCRPHPRRGWLAYIPEIATMKQTEGLAAEF